MAAPVPPDALRSFFTKGRPKTARAVGAEFELLVVDRRTAKEVPFGGERGIEAVLRHILERGKGWTAVNIDGRLIALDRPDGSAITLEPGSQLEFSTPPRRDALQVDADVRAFAAEFREATAGLDLALTGIGLNPFSATQEVELGPKPRYRIMNDYLSKRGDLALDMMRRTCSVHVTFDYRDEADVVDMQRVAFAVTPLVVAMFAHSPLEKLRPNGFKSFRWEVWQRTDGDRAGLLPGVFDHGFGFDDYVKGVLALPLIFTLKDDVYRPANGRPAGDWFAGKTELFPDAASLSPVAEDLEWVINQSFRDVRLRRYLECRAADFPPARMISAPVALWTGLLYDERARKEAWELVAGVAPAKPGVLPDLPVRQRLTASVSREGLAAIATKNGASALELARDLARIAHGGLVRRVLGEERLLEPLLAQLDTGKTPAESLLEKLGPGPISASKLIDSIEL